MAYIALKPCRFDKEYFIGDTIPDEVISPARVKALIDIGKIAIDSNAPAPAPAPAKKEEAINYDDITKAQLIEMAEEYGIDLNSKMNKADMIEIIEAAKKELEA